MEGIIRYKKLGGSNNIQGIHIVDDEAKDI